MMRVVDQKSMFVKDVVVAGLTLKALVDTGGKVSTIQEKFAKRVGELKPSHKVLRGFGKKGTHMGSGYGYHTWRRCNSAESVGNDEAKR